MEYSDPIEAHLRDYGDGACRDMNFDCASWEGTARFVEYLSLRFPRRQMRDVEGVEHNDLGALRIASGIPPGGDLSLVFKNGSEILTDIQLYIFTQEDGSPFVELTFFPECVAPGSDTARRFVEFARKALELLEATEFFCRYENASWEPGKPLEDSGVFLIGSASEVRFIPENT